MFFELKDVNDKKLEKDYKKIMSELNDFYGINWVNNLPKIYLVDSRKQIDNLMGRKTIGWVIGWTGNLDVYVLKNEKMETESLHKKHTDEKYYSFIKHEISHCFTTVLSDFSEFIPKWLWEGVATYTSDGNKFKATPIKFETFLNFYDQNGFATGVYAESGFAVELLVKKFGKKKLLTLVKNSKKYPSKKLFEIAFKKLYGFKPSYTDFNKLLNA